MNIVLDTNVLVAGLLSPDGTCGRIITLLTAAEFTPCIDSRIMAEYEDVLHRPRFDFNEEYVEGLLDYIHHNALVYAPAPLPLTLPDPDDLMFLETALTAHADAVVTGNLKHFPALKRRRIKIISPRDFLDSLSGYK